MWREPCKLRSPLDLIEIFAGVRLYQGYFQLFHPRDEIAKLFFHIVVLLIGDR